MAFTATPLGSDVAGQALKRETGGQNPCGFQSKPKSKCRFSLFGQQRGNPASRGPTRSAGPNAAVPVAAKDELGFPETSCKRHARRPGCGREVFDNSARRQGCRATSRPWIEIPVLNFRKGAWIRLELRGDFIPQGGERGTRARVGQNAFPRPVAVQLRQDFRQIRHQLFPFRSRQRLNGRLDFLNRAHATASIAQPCHFWQTPCRLIALQARRATRSIPGWSAGVHAGLNRRHSGWKTGLPDVPRIQSRRGRQRSLAAVGCFLLTVTARRG